MFLYFCSENEQEGEESEKTGEEGEEGEDASDGPAGPWNASQSASTPAETKPVKEGGSLTLVL